MEQHIIAKRDEEVIELLMNRPNSFNAFGLTMVDQFAEHLITIAADDTIRAVVITGEGKAFCAGGDLKWMASFPNGPYASVHELAARFHQAILEIRRMPKPVIAGINGPAAGGGFSLALACDLRVISESAFLQQAYTSNGLCLDGGGTFTLPRIAGFARAMEIAAFDQPISSEQALNWGLVTKVVQDGTAREEAMRMAHQMAKRSIHAFGWAKRLFNDSFNTTFETQIEREREAVAKCADHPDGGEGRAAFEEKRKPIFY
jgi:2-(1,2-epoxy-1,2-dihydrophenyl)acetyl-CoA isomerase